MYRFRVSADSSAIIDALEPLPLLLRAVLGAVAAAAGVYDLRTRRIPNWLIAVGLAAALAAQGTRGWAGVREAGLGILLALAVYLPLYALRAVGGGDVKLMAAIGVAAGPGNWLVIFVLASLIGGAMAVFMIVTRGRLRRTASNIAAIFGSLLRFNAPYRNRPDLDVRDSSSMRLPHGVSIALGVALYLAAVH